MASLRISLLVSCLILGGCADLSAVRDISSRLTIASKNWNEVSADIAGSCQRELALNPQIRDCQLERKASDGLVAADAVLTDYFSALFAAATETNFSVKPGLDKATAAVASIEGIDEAKVKAVSGLVGLLVKIAGERLREDTLRELIALGGPAAQLVIGGLREIVVTRLRGRLDAEKTQLSAYFGRAILAQRDPIGTDLESACAGSKASAYSATGFLLALEFCKRVEVSTARQKALSDYEDSLASASKALAELQFSAANLKAADLARKLYGISKELDDSLIAVRKAFN